MPGLLVFVVDRDPRDQFFEVCGHVPQQAPHLRIEQELGAWCVQPSPRPRPVS